MIDQILEAPFTAIIMLCVLFLLFILFHAMGFKQGYKEGKEAATRWDFNNPYETKEEHHEYIKRLKQK